MKKYLLFLLALPALSFGQWTENFDVSTTLPTGWAIINDGSLNGWEFIDISTGAQSANNVAYIHTPISTTPTSTAHDDYLITKAINVQPGVSDKISFFIRSGPFNSDLSDYKVLLSTTNQTKNSFTVTLQPEQKAPFTWTEKTFDLSAYNGKTVYVAIQATGTNTNLLLVDTFKVYATPSLGTSDTTLHQNNNNLYPNPFKDIVHISDITKVKSISISDTSGKLIKIIDKPTSVLNLAELMQGVYLITLHQKDGTKRTIKAIKE